MSIEVEGPDGVSIEFPDGTSPATIQGVMRKRYGGPGSPPAAAPSRPPPAAGRSFMDGAPTKPLLGQGKDDLGSRLLALGDNTVRTVAGAGGDLADGIAGLLNRPINATLDTFGADPRYRLPVDQVGKAIPQPVGVVPQASRAIAPYFAGSTGLSRVFAATAPKIAAAVTGGAEAAIAARVAPKIVTPIRAGIAAGAPVDAALSSGQDKNLSSMIADLGGPTLPTARVAGENEGVAAVKDMTEGAVVGGLAEKLLDVFMAGRRSAQGMAQAIPQDPAAALPVDELPPAFADEIVTPPPAAVIDPVAEARPLEAAPPAAAVVDEVPVVAPEEAIPNGEVIPPLAPEISQAQPVVEVPPAAPGVVPVEQAVAEAAAQAEGPPSIVKPVAGNATEGAGPEAAAASGETIAPSARPAAEAAGEVTEPALKADPELAPDQPVMARAEGPVTAAQTEEIPASPVGSQETLSDVPAPAAKTVSAADPNNFDAEAFYDRTYGANAKPIPGPAITPPSRGGTKLYSNPADPEAIKELLVDPAARVIKKEIDGFKTDFDQVKSDFKGFSENASPQKALDSAGRAVRKVWWSNTAAIRSVAAKHKDVPEIRELADKIGTDPGRGRVVEQTYERAVQMRSMGMSNRLSNLLGEKVKPDFEGRIADALAGRAKPVGGSGEEETARRVRKLLDEQHDYMVKAGLDVGYVKGRYYPRIVDEDAVLKDPLGFKAKAQEVYAKMGLDEAKAAESAEDWYSRILGVRNGAYASGLPNSNATKGRSLPPEADEILADFYSKDPRANLTAYFRQTSRAAEFARSFGANGEKVDELFNGMLKKGVNPREVDNLRHHFESAAGLLYSTRPDAGASALSWIQTAGVLRLLPRAVISSAVEGLAAGVRAHDVGAGFKAMADSYGIVFGLDKAEDVRQTAEMLGIVGDAMNDLVLSAQFGGEVGGLAQQKLLSRFFRTTQLHQITEAQRLAATRVGQGMLRTLLQDVGEGTKRKASAARLLAELGMDEAGAKGVSDWLASNGGAPPVADLLGDKREAQLYRTALQRFVDESIQSPTAADRPQWANHPYGRLAYGISSFMFSFTRNVLIRTGRETAEGVFGKGYTLEDRARLLAPMIGLAVLTAAQGQVSELREKLMNPQAQGEKSDFQKTVTNLSRAGAFGNADPFINVAMSARYNRDLTSSLTGPYLTAYLDSLSKMTVGLIPKSMGGPNSENTNNAEWQATKAGYESVMAPMIAAAASYAPGGPLLRLGYGAGIVGATAPGVSRGVADTVVGEREVKPRPKPDE